ncbi:glucokinase [Devosia sp.]|uniref:glucokinase n=1 Tax=Devosia sp. TaxID=1871048 RepID=UPI001ACEA3A6|nr:glucokinase [Devosia sp.]MBN9310717.1 glucokinase [Devosia sp.]
MTEHSRQALVGAFGATYISLAIADIDELSVSSFALLNTADFERPMQAVERYLTSIPRCPNKVSIALAGEVEGDGATFTHRDWTLTRNDVRAATGADHVCLINDIEATALALPNLSAYDVQELIPGKARPYGNKAVLMAGAAAGIAGLVRVGDSWMPVAGEGGFMRFAPAAADGVDLGDTFPPGSYLSCNDIFTGKGLVALYRALATAEKAPVAAAGARQIAAAGLSGKDPVAARSLQVIATWLGRVAGDIALLYGARGGLYLGGGMIANTIPALQTGHFREAFEHRGLRSDYISKVPVYVIKTAADAGLRGAALAMARSLQAAAPAHRPVSRAAS